MKIKYIIYFLIIAFFGYLIYNRISKNKAEGAGPKAAVNKKSRVEGMVIRPEAFSDAVSVSGTIEANEQIQLRSEISGLIETINFREGSYVNKGALLVKINDQELQAQLAQAITKERLAAETENRSGKLLKAEAISQEEYDNVEAEPRSLKAQTQLVRAQLAKTEIRAPFSGKIGLRYVSKGAFVSPTTDIANLVSIDPVKISFSVPEKYAQRIEDGSPIKFTVAGAAEPFHAKIYAQEPSINANTRSLLLKAMAPNTKGKLLPGTFANISLPLNTIDKAILVPTESVVPVLDGKQVFIQKNGKALPVKIESDIRTDKSLLVTSGLSAGDTLITTGVMFLKEGMPVAVNLVKSEQRTQTK